MPVGKARQGSVIKEILRKQVLNDLVDVQEPEGAVGIEATNFPKVVVERVQVLVDFLGCANQTKVKRT